MTEKELQNLKDVLVNDELTIISNLEMDEEQKAEKLKNLKASMSIVLAAEKSAQEQQKIDNLKRENERKLDIEDLKASNESTRIENDYKLRMEEFTYKREELKFKGQQLEQDMKQFELDCETRVKEAKWGALWHGIGEALGISRFMLWRHDRKNMYRSECVIQHKEMNVVTPTQKEINKEYADLIRKEIK